MCRYLRCATIVFADHLTCMRSITLSGDGCPSVPAVAPSIDSPSKFGSVLEYCQMSIVHNVHMLHTMQHLLAVFQITL